MHAGLPGMLAARLVAALALLGAGRADADEAASDAASGFAPGGHVHAVIRPHAPPDGALDGAQPPLESDDWWWSAADEPSKVIGSSGVAESGGTYASAVSQSPSEPDVEDLSCLARQPSMTEWRTDSMVSPGYECAGRVVVGTACRVHTSCAACIAFGCGWCIDSGSCVVDEPYGCSGDDVHVSATGTSTHLLTRLRVF